MGQMTLISVIFYYVTFVNFETLPLRFSDESIATMKLKWLYVYIAANKFFSIHPKIGNFLPLSEISCLHIKKHSQ
jgi:hypothetical protein